MPCLSARLLLLTLLTLFTWAGQAQPSQPETQARTQAQTYTTLTGDTLEKVVQKHYAGSPLQHSVLIDQVKALNAASVGKTAARQRLKTGMTLQMPAHEVVVQRALSPYLPTEPQALAADNGPQARKRWVHYP